MIARRVTRFTTRPELVGTFGMVASTHWLASGAGMAVLERGGNAFDAAVAAGFVLQVVEPHLNGPGGEVPALLWSAEREEARVLCGQGVTPAAATPEAFRALGLDLVPGTGFLPACVPGAFDAWMLLLRDHGTWRVRDVLAFAIHSARRGFPVLAPIAGAIGAVAATFARDWPTSAALWLPRGRAPAVGTLHANPVLAGTYERLVAEAEAGGGGREEEIDAARAAFARGFVAEAIDAFLREEVLDVSGRRHAGLLRGDDLAGWEASWEAPVALDHGGVTVCKTGPWGQGPVMLQQLALLAGFDLEALGRESAELVHLVVECAKLAFADREAWYGDPAFTDVPLAGLLDPGYAHTRRRLVGAEASGELRPGRPEGREPRLPDGPAQARAGAGVGEPTLSRDTCHLDVADRWGNLVSATPSGGWLQSSPAVPGLGFCLGTRAQMGWVQEGLPATIAPGKRPRTTLTPSLALRDGEGWLAWGTPGGDQQDQWSLVFLLSHLHFGLNLQEAIDAPMFHTAHFPSSFYPRVAEPRRVELEDRFGPEVLAGLRGRGHDAVASGPWSLGRLSAVRRDPDGTLRAGANPRGMQGYAVGR